MPVLYTAYTQASWRFTGRTRKVPLVSMRLAMRCILSDSGRDRSTICLLLRRPKRSRNSGEALCVYDVQGGRGIEPLNHDARLIVGGKIGRANHPVKSSFIEPILAVLKRHSAAR